jgi:hypothetical protein
MFMTITINSEYIYLGVTLILMLVQVLQWRVASKLKKEVDNLWTQISIIAMSSGNILEKIERKLDGKEDRK